MKISVYVTSYNQKRYLAEAIESVLGQTVPPIEIIIVDDASADGSQEIIEGYASRYPEIITPIYHTMNQGVAQTRVDALQALTGDYVTSLDGDDRYLPTKLEKEANLLQDNHNAKIAFSNFYFMTDAGVRTRLWATDDTPPQGYIFRETFSRMFPQQTLFRNELVDFKAWKSIGFHDPSLPLYEDYEMRIRLTKQLETVYCDEPLAEYRIHSAGLSAAGATQHLAALEYIYHRNKSLLRDLSVTERKEIRRKLGALMASFAKQAAEEVLRENPSLGNKLVQCLKYRFRSVQYRRGCLDLALHRRIVGMSIW